MHRDRRVLDGFRRCRNRRRRGRVLPHVDDDQIGFDLEGKGVVAADVAVDVNRAGSDVVRADAVGDDEF